MLKSTEQQQLPLSDFNNLYDILIEKDNFWRKLNENMDFQFIFDEVKENYSDSMGRASKDPILLFKLILLKESEKLSDRDVIKRLKTDMLFKYFLGYAPEETKFMHHSLLSKFRRTRLKNTNLLDVMIQKTIEVALSSGLIDEKEILIMDATHTNAMFQHRSPREELIKRAKELRKTIYRFDESVKDKMPKKKESSGLLEDQIEYCENLISIVGKDERFKNINAIQEKLNYLKEGVEDTVVELEYSKDKDAKIGHKSADTSFFGYKTHLAMTPERIITAAVITSGEKHDGKQLQELVEKSEANGVDVGAVVGDGAYSEKDNIKYAEEKQIKLASKLSKSVTHGNRVNDTFEYNKDAGMYVCAAGHMAIRKAKQGMKVDKKGCDTKVETYYFDVEKCKRCEHKEGCYKEGAKSKSYSVKIKQDIHIKHMEYMESDEFKELYKERYKIEAKNAELKMNYGYQNADGCGLLGISIQGASAIFLSNMRRIEKLMEEKTKNNG